MFALAKGVLETVYRHVKHDIKLTLTLALSVIGAGFLLVFGLFSLNDGNHVLASYLLGPLCLGLFNIVLLTTKKQALASINLAVLCGIISALLLAHGGKEQTGIFWTYPLITIAIAILKYKQGLLFACIYLVLSALILYLPLDAAFFAEYSTVTSSRYLFACLALCSITLTLVNIQEKMTSQLHIKTITDELTGLHNRAIIRSQLDTTFLNQDMLHTASLVMVDIDYFKHINDDFGHAVGDQVLIAVSQVLKSSLRINDLAIRWGGEEFLLILPNCSKQDALDKANIISQKLANHSELNVILNRDITLSMGISEMAKNEDLYDSIKQADQNLYKAKAGGRNQIFCDTELMSSQT